MGDGTRPWQPFALPIGDEHGTMIGLVGVDPDAGTVEAQYFDPAGRAPPRGPDAAATAPPRTLAAAIAAANSHLIPGLRAEIGYNGGSITVRSGGQWVPELYAGPDESAAIDAVVAWVREVSGGEIDLAAPTAPETPIDAAATDDAADHAQTLLLRLQEMVRPEHRTAAADLLADLAAIWTGLARGEG